MDQNQTDCIYHEDCNPFYYCNKASKRCNRYLNESQTCYYHEQCGREMLCRKFSQNATESEHGKCTKFFSLEKGEIIDIYDSNYWLQFQCKDGYADIKTRSDKYSSTGKCGYKIQSLNAGEKCVSDEDCPTNLQDFYSRCSCTPNKDGAAFCEYDSGNDQWVDVIKLFKKYVEDTKSCHISRGLNHHCFDPQKTAKYLWQLGPFINFSKIHKVEDCLLEIAGIYFEPEIYWWKTMKVAERDRKKSFRERLATLNEKMKTKAKALKDRAKDAMKKKDDEEEIDTSLLGPTTTLEDYFTNQTAARLLDL